MTDKDLGAAPPLIRRAAAADIPAMRALLRETWHQVYDPIIGAAAVDEVSARWHAPELLAKELATPGASCLVACDGELLVGQASAHRRDPATLVISRLYIKPGHQGRGLGPRFIAALRERYAAISLLHLFVAGENARAVAFYRREGFAVVREGVEEGARVLFMEKPLV